MRAYLVCILLFGILLPGRSSMAQATGSRSTKLMAHRGMPTYAPENTSLSVGLAKELGFQAVEVDIHATADDVLMVFHDRDLRRLGKQKSLCETSANELTDESLLDLFLYDQFKLSKEVVHQLKDINDPWLVSLSSARPLRLERLLEQFGKNFTILLDVKHLGCAGDKRAALRKLGKLISRLGLAKRVYFESQDLELLTTYKRLYPDHLVSYWYDDAFRFSDERLDDLRAQRIDAIDFHWGKLDESALSRFEGFQLFTFTVNSPERIKELQGKVDFIMTDRDFVSGRGLDAFEFFNSRSEKVKILKRSSELDSFLSGGFEHWYRGELAEVLLRR